MQLTKFIVSDKHFRKFLIDGAYLIAFIFNNGWIIGFLIGWLRPHLYFSSAWRECLFPSLSDVKIIKLPFEVFASSARGRDKAVSEEVLNFQCSDLDMFFFKFSKPSLTSCLCAFAWAVSLILGSLPLPDLAWLFLPMLRLSLLTDGMKYSFIFHMSYQLLQSDVLNWFPSYLQ